jgi:energy-coupling factor transport system permease protein
VANLKGGVFIQIYLLDARTKIILLLVVFVFVALSPGLYAEFTMMAIITLLAFLHGVYRRCFSFWLVYAVAHALILCCAQFPGTLTSVLIIILAILCKAIPTVMYTFCVLLTTKISSLISAMQKMSVPPRITIPLAAGLRFFPTALDELRHVREAMRLRGIQLNLKNLLTRPGLVFEGAIVPLMLRSATIAEELSAASVTRGLSADHKRTSILRFRLSTCDALWLILFLTPFAVEGLDKFL